ncbi:hypothetical protein ACHAXR_011858 [Thalassiosira sp. AJA248-18]
MARGNTSRGRGGGGGRIRPGDRDTDDITAPIAAGVGLAAADAAAIEETESKSMTDRCRKDYRNRIKRIIAWLSTKEEYRECYRDGIRELSEEERTKPNKYYFNHTHDLVYAGFRVDIFKAFLSQTKVRWVDDEGNEILKSPEDLRKYGDAVKWAAEMAGQMLSRTYYHEMDKWKASYKKEYAQAKKAGRVEENEADPITAKLFRLMCKWAIEENNVFLWVFSLLQWNLMARSINIDPIAFHNIKRGGEDSIEFTPDTTKTDQAGEFVTMKNVYGNPKEPRVNVFLALAVWTSLNSTKLTQSEKLFLSEDVLEGAASKKYCRQLSEMMKRHNEQVRKHINSRKANPHGIRKGGATEATSCCMFPPSLISVMARGEWSLGKIIDTYFKFGYGGDCYLGQVLSLKDANSKDFAMLPAHWKDPTDELIAEGVACCFPGILDKHGHRDNNPSGLLDLFLAQLVYHSDFLKQTVHNFPSHDFGSLPLVFDNPELLNALKERVTLEPSPDISRATGIPPHITHSIEIQKTIDICGEVKDAVLKLDKTIADTISTAIDEKVKSNGNVNITIMNQAFERFRKDIVEELKVMWPATAAPASQSTEEGVFFDSTTIFVADEYTFAYDGKKWCVPESFAFPDRVNLLNAWRKWWLGHVIVVNKKQYKIMPFRHLSDKMLQSNRLKNDLKNKWRPILTKMMAAPGLNVDAAFVPNDTWLKQTFDVAMNHLRFRFSFLFTPANEDQFEKWKLSTWSKRTQRAYVLQHGTDSDKQQLPPATKRNRKHKEQRSFSVVHTKPRKSKKQ